MEESLEEYKKSVQRFKDSLIYLAATNPSLEKELFNIIKNCVPEERK